MYQVCFVYILFYSILLPIDDNFLTAYPLKHEGGKLVPYSPLQVKIKSVVCGAGFALFLTPSGAVFSKGIGT